ncbi:hypothetical protein ACX93W_05290 [Paenibacillus sp. CAU 1782]
MYLDLEQLERMQDGIERYSRYFDLFYDEEIKMNDYLKDTLKDDELVTAIVEGIILRAHAKFEMLMKDFCENIRFSMEIRVRLSDYHSTGILTFVRYLEGLLPINFKKENKELCETVERWSNLRNSIAHNDSMLPYNTDNELKRLNKIREATKVYFDFETHEKFIFVLLDHKNFMIDLKHFTNKLFSVINEIVCSDDHELD